MFDKTDAFYFERTAKLARECLARGDDGFAALLVNVDGDIVLEQGNEASTRKDPTAHDAMLLVQKAVQQYSSAQLKDFTVYALVEPCVMCMGAIFWSGIGNVKYAMSEAEMNTIIPGNLDISSKEFAKRSPRLINVTGDFPEIRDAIGTRDIVKDWVRSLGIPGLPLD